MGERLQGRVAIVTGAGSVGEGWGNGKAAAALYAREGAVVMCVDHHLAAAQETVALIQAEGGTAFAHQTDVGKPRELQAMVEACIARHGRVDILHNNVGIEDVSPLEELTEASWDRVHDINLKSVVFACKYVMPHMRAQKRGAIVNISSIASIRWGGVPYYSYYSSKAALNHLTKVIARKHARDGVRANVILPGLIDTPHVRTQIPGDAQQQEAVIADRNRRCPMGFMGSPWDIAQAALFLAGPESRFVTGVTLPVDGGVTQVGPLAAYERVSGE